MIGYSSKNIPVTYEQNGKSYAFHTDFREWIRFEALMLDADVPENLKILMSLQLVFAGKLPDDIPAAVDFVLWFHRGGEQVRSRAEGNLLGTRRIYDFEYDSDYIYAAFLQQYGIDLLNVEYMHWWKFRALFKGLRECKITDIMSYRGTEISDDLPDSRRAFLLDMQELYELPITLTEQRKIGKARKYLDT